MSTRQTVVGFGSNYSHNMGPAKRSALKMSDDDDEINCYKLEGAPWEKDDDELASIATSASSSVFLTSRGKIYSCGTVHGKMRTRLTETVIQLPLKCVEIAAGRHFALARMEGGLAVCSWGAGHFGQLVLGVDSPPFVQHPTVIEALLPHVVGAPVSAISAGHWHAMAATQLGTVYAWGCNRNAQCGFKPHKDPPTVCNPQLVRFEASSPTKIVKVAGGRAHSVALDEEGKVYCWGACQYGQCGILVRRRGGVSSPRQVESLNEVKIADIAAGDTHTLALTGGGRVFAFGSGFEGQLGGRMLIQMNPKPKLIGDLDFVAIEAGREYKVHQSNEERHANLSQQDNKSSLSQIPRIVSVHATGNCSMAISSIGQVYAWGCNDVSNLGISKPSHTLPFAEPGFAEAGTSSLRPFDTQSFDSSHNIGIPQRVESLSHLRVSIIAASPTFMWCAGTPILEASGGDSSEADESQSSHDNAAEGRQHGNSLAHDGPDLDSSSSPPIDPPEIKDGGSILKTASSQEKVQNDVGDRSKISTKSPATPKPKRRFSIPKAIGKLVRRASLNNSSRLDAGIED